MFEYRENINYCQQETYNVDAELQELNALCAKGISDYQLYLTIRQYIYKQLKVKQLAVTKILNDILRMRKEKSLRTVEIVMFFVANNDLPYSEIADYFGCSKQYVNQLLNDLSEQFLWLRALIEIKGEEDTINGNNREGKIVAPNKGRIKPHTAWLWEQD